MILLSDSKTKEKTFMSRMLSHVVFRGAGFFVWRMFSLHINTQKLTQLETLFSLRQNFCETLRVKITQNPSSWRLQLRQMGYTSAFIFTERTLLVLNLSWWLWEIKNHAQRKQFCWYLWRQITPRIFLWEIIGFGNFFIFFASGWKWSIGRSSQRW